MKFEPALTEGVMLEALAEKSSTQDTGQKSLSPKPYSLSSVLESTNKVLSG